MSRPIREEKCRNCGKRFLTDRSAQKHCSENCRREHNGKKPMVNLKTIQCGYCGEKFNTLRKRKYCSEKCRNKAHDCMPREVKKKKLLISLSEINRLAREEGLTYGQHVGKYGL